MIFDSSFVNALTFRSVRNEPVRRRNLGPRGLGFGCARCRRIPWIARSSKGCERPVGKLCWNCRRFGSWFGRVGLSLGMRLPDADCRGMSRIRPVPMARKGSFHERAVQFIVEHLLLPGIQDAAYHMRGTMGESSGYLNETLISCVFYFRLS